METPADGRGGRGSTTEGVRWTADAGRRGSIRLLNGEGADSRFQPTAAI